MKRLVTWSTVVLVFLLGCVSARKTATPSRSKSVPAVSTRSISRTAGQGPSVTAPAADQEMSADAATVLPMGRILAKTIFEGIVQTSYVKLDIVDQAAPQKNFQLIIGDQARQQNFPWQIQTVQPGYFFIELPAGDYRFSALTIPVGTTVATEPMDVTFTVKENKVVYLGTMKVLGTKDKIKLGGVPLIKPGFEYSVQVLDEEPEARGEFEQRYRQHGEFEADLMEVHPLEDQMPASS